MSARSVTPGVLVGVNGSGGRNGALWLCVSTSTGGEVTVDLSTPPRLIQEIDPRQALDQHTLTALGCVTTQRYHASPIAAAREILEGRTILRPDAFERALRWRPSVDGLAGAVFRRWKPTHPETGSRYSRWTPNTAYTTQTRVVGDPGPTSAGPFAEGIPRYQFRCVGGGGTSGATIDWDAAFASWSSTGLWTDSGGVQWAIAGGAEGAWDPET